MKEIVQDTGKRPYTGDDFLMLQNEQMAIWESLFAPFGNFIIGGLEITDNGGGTYNVSSGLVMLDGKIRRFYGAQNVNLPIYLIPTEETTNKQYFDGQSKPAKIEYKTVYQTTQPVGVNYLTINPSGNRTWRDAIQDSLHRMVTDTMISAWNNHSANTNNPHQVTPSQIGAAKTDMSNVADIIILDKLKNVDGAGSGLDADTLQGKKPDELTNYVEAAGQIEATKGTIYYNLTQNTLYIKTSNGWKNIALIGEPGQNGTIYASDFELQD